MSIYATEDIQGRVEEWLSRNTYSKDSFTNLEDIIRLKHAQHVTIALVIPTLDEAENISNVLTFARELCQPDCPVLDECVVMDSGSTDDTVNICRERYSDIARVYDIHDVLPCVPVDRPGKGDGLWRSLHVTTSDLVIFMDADLKKLHRGFVSGIAGPLLTRSEVQFVKGFYRRSCQGEIGGGRVTELCVRPLLNIAWPQLAGILQPLGGEYGGRRSCLENIHFSSGYGVELETLIEVYRRYGLQSIAQVDLDERIHCSQTLSSLSRMACAQTQVAMRKLAEEEHQQQNGVHGLSLLSRLATPCNMVVPHNKVPRDEKLRVRETGNTGVGMNNSVANVTMRIYEIKDTQRPPMISLREYRSVHGSHHDNAGKTRDSCHSDAVKTRTQGHSNGAKIHASGHGDVVTHYNGHGQVDVMKTHDNSHCGVVKTHDNCHSNHGNGMITHANGLGNVVKTHDNGHGKE